MPTPFLTCPPLFSLYPFLSLGDNRGSCSLSLSMARGTSFPALLTALFFFFLLQTSSVKNIHLAAAGCSSSCGSIQNISYPFRLMDDPPNCGDHRYNLSCENKITVLYLYAGKYHVQEINYSDYSIRVVDSVIQRDNFSSIPRYSLSYYNFSRGVQDYLSPFSSICRERSPITMVFLSCEKQVNSPSYRNLSTSCFKNGVYSSNSSSSSQMHRYVAYDLIPYPEEVEESCRIELISLTSWEAHRYTKTASCEEIHNELLYGFKLDWFSVYCECGVRPDYCYLGQCYNNETYIEGSSGLFKRLEGLYNDVMYGLGRASEFMTQGKLPQVLYAAVHYNGWPEPSEF